MGLFNEMQERFDAMKAERDHAIQNVVRLQAEVDALRTVLDEAVTGLEWWEANHSDGSSGADDEFRERVADAKALHRPGYETK